MGWDGDISQMGHLADRIGDLARVPSRIAATVSRTIADLIQDEFDEGADPYGKAWAPLADATLDKGRTPPPLTDREYLRGSVLVRPMRPAGIAITVAAPYAAPHQTGWVGPRSSGPARPILPARAELPPAWQDAIEEAAEADVRKVVRS